MKNIRRATRKQYFSEEKIRIVLTGLRGEESIAELCRREMRVETSREHEKGDSMPDWKGEKGGRE